MLHDVAAHLGLWPCLGQLVSAVRCAVLELTGQILVVDGRCVLLRGLWGTLTHMYSCASIPLAWEPLDFSLYRIVYEVRAIILRIPITVWIRLLASIIDVGTCSICSLIHLLTLIYTRLLRFLTPTKVSRLCSELLTLIKLVEMRGVLIDRLWSFLILTGLMMVASDVIRSGNRATPRVELLYTLHQVRILRVSCQNSRLIQMLSTIVLHPMNFHPYLNASLF